MNELKTILLKPNKFKPHNLKEPFYITTNNKEIILNDDNFINVLTTDINKDMFIIQKK